MIELTLTPEFSHLRLEKVDSGRYSITYRLTSDGTMHGSTGFTIIMGFYSIVVHIDARLPPIDYQRTFVLNFVTEWRRDQISGPVYKIQKIAKPEKPNVAQFKQTKFDCINNHGTKAKPSKFFTKSNKTTGLGYKKPLYLNLV